MMRLFACAAMLPLLAANDTVTVAVRGKSQTLVRIMPANGKARAAVIFLPGDGGWRGEAVRMANTVATFGYEVYGFDTKEYLEANSQNGAKLSRDDLSADMRRLAEQVSTLAGKPVLFVGWSQGAGMAIAA